MDEDIRQLKQAIEVLEGLYYQERSQGKHKEALDRARRIVELAQKLDSIENSVDSHRTLIEKQERVEELEEIYKRLEEEILEEHISPETIEQVSDMLEGAQSFTKSGDIAFISGSFSEAEFLYETAHEFNYMAVKLWENYETLRELEIIQRKLGYLYEQVGDLKRAKELITSNIDINKKLLEDHKSLEAYNNIAFSFSNLGDLLLEDETDQAIKHYEEGLNYRREAVRKIQTGDAYQKLLTDLLALARVYQRLDLDQKALELYKESIPVLNRLLEFGDGTGKEQMILEIVKDQIDQLALD